MSWRDDMKKAAEDGDKEAQKCVAALDEEPAKDDGKKDKENPEEKKSKAEEPPKDKKAEAEPPAKKEDEPSDDDKKAAKAHAATIAMLGEHDRVLATMRKEKEDADREGILEKLELTDNQKKALTAMPLAQMKLTVDVGNFKKKVSGTLAERAGAAMIAGTRGAGMGASSLDPTMAQKIDQKMGIGQDDQRVRMEKNEQILPSSLSQDGAREIIKRNKERAASARGGLK